MPSYFATFISGCQDIIASRLRKFPAASVKIMEVEDGLVLFESSLNENQLAELRFLNNVYQQLPSDLSVPALPAGTFTIRAREGSQPGAVPDGLKQRIVASGLQFSAHNPTYEFFWWRRTDGRELWGLALPRAGFKRRNLEAGELRPELAHILGLVAGLDAKDVVLDPFAGYGAIVRECLQGFHCQEVIAVEQNEHLIPHLKSIPRLVALQGDAGQLPHVGTRAIDRIITDPPWGNFDGQDEAGLQQLYRGAFNQIHRVLRTKGSAVVLTAVPWLSTIAAECAFDVVKQYPILVSGRQATIYKLRKLG